MTEQQYRVIADRDKGDDPTTADICAGDRYTMQAERGPVFADQVMRIERPVPTEHCLSTAHHVAHEWGNHDGQPGTGFWCPGFDATDERPVPTTDEPQQPFVAVPLDVYEASIGMLRLRGAEATADMLRDEAIHPSLPTREQIAGAWMSHLGYTAVEIHDAAERGHVGAGCEWDWNHQAWECEDENGKSNHPAYDELVTAYEMADAVHALLSQPTPTAEQVSVVRCFNEQPHEAHDWTLYYAQPPSDHRCPGVIFNATAAPHTPFCVRTSTPDNPCRCWKSGSTDEED